MPDPVSSASTVRAYQIIGRGETFDVSPTQSEQKQIVAARAQRAQQGHAQGNVGLSMRRAKAVAAYIKKLIPNARVDVRAAGESAPYQKGSVDGSESFMDRAVEIGVARAGGNKAVRVDPRSKGVDQQQFMHQTFGRFASEARVVALLKAIDFPNMQSLQQSRSGQNKSMIKNNVLQYILKMSLPIIQKKYPDLSGQQVIDALKSWHQTIKQGR